MSDWANPPESPSCPQGWIQTILYRLLQCKMAFSSVFGRPFFAVLHNQNINGAFH